MFREIDDHTLYHRGSERDAGFNLLRTIGLAALTAAWAGTACAAVVCQPGEAIAFPGPKFDAWYSEVKSQLPRAAACEDPKVESCSVRGRHGYVYWFSMRDPRPPANKRLDRYLFRIEIRPGDPATPPFGLAWGDDVATAKVKLKAAGYPLTIDMREHEKGRVVDFGSIGCFSRKGEDEDYAYSFTFRDGKLVRIDQSIPYP